MRVLIEEDVRREAFVVYLSTMLLQGVPDLFLQYRGAGVWLELKFARLLSPNPNTGALSHKLEATQRRFIRDVRKHGGFGFVPVAFEVGEKYPRIALMDLEDFDDKGQVTCGHLRGAARQSILQEGVAGPWLLAMIAEATAAR